MMRLILCVGREHSPGLLLLAVLVCMAGSLTTAQLFIRARSATRTLRVGWLGLTAVSSGAMIWSTHFVAMMAFRMAAPVFLDPGLTLASLLIAIVAAIPGLAIATGSGRSAQWTGGAVVGAAVSAMHYTGMAAYRIDGFVAWDAGYVAASVLLASLLAACAFRVLGTGSGVSAVTRGGLLLGAAVALLHFTGMAALTITPATLHGEGLSKATMTVMAVATVFAGLLVTSCAAVSVLIDGHTRGDTSRRLLRLALIDNLTQLPNRARFNEDLARALAAPPQGVLALVMIDLCGFKIINDRFGHQAGDQLLTAIAGRLEGVLHQGWRAYRLGGDEFAALLPAATADESAAAVRTIADVFTRDFVFERFSTPCDASLGAALSPMDGRNADRLVANADLAMYRAKAARSRKPFFYDVEMDKAARDARELTTELKSAVTRGELDLFYQVQASMLTGEVSGYEALARWSHPTRGFVSPGVFIPLAEDIGEIGRLGSWVLRRACYEAASWNKPHPVAVNLSPFQLSDPMLMVQIREVLRDSGLRPGRLEIELTESAIIRDRGQAVRQLRDLKAMGVTLALDDFGTGYSSLDVLRSFPFDRIKLDASFVAEIEQSEQAVVILNSVAALGRTLGVSVLAEGVETAAQLHIVQRGGCSDVQGYLLGRPARELVDEAKLKRTLLEAYASPKRIGLAA